MHHAATDIAPRPAPNATQNAPAASAQENMAAWHCAHVFHAASLSDGQVFAPMGVNLIQRKLSKFMRLRAVGDAKSNGVAFVINMLPALQIAGFWFTLPKFNSSPLKSYLDPIGK